MTVEVQEPAEGGRAVSPLLVPVLTLGVTINIMSARALAVFLPVIAVDLDTSVALLGQVPALMLLLAGALALVAGPLADRYGFRRMLVIGLLSVVVSAVATGLSPNLPILLAVTLVGAVARASVLPTAQAVVVTAFTDEDARRRAISWVTTGLSSAAIIGVPLMTTIAGASSWRVSFFVMGGLGLVAAILLQRTMSDMRPSTSGPLSLRNLLDSYAPLRRHRPTILVMAATLAADAGVWSCLTYYTAFLVQRHGFSIEEVGWVQLGIGVLALGGTVLTGGRVGASPRPLLLASRTILGLCLAGSVAASLPWYVSVALVLLAGPMLGIADLTTTLVLTAVSPAGRATTLTLRSAAVCIGTALGGAFGGLLLALGDYATLGICSLALLLTATALFWWSGAGRTTLPAPTSSA